MSKKYLLKLFVTGKTPRAESAISDLCRICEEEFPDEYELIVIDILKRPQLAEDEKILATPTVIKELPLPIRRIIGDLCEKEKVLLGLDLVARRKGNIEKQHRGDFTQAVTLCKGK